MMGVIVRRIAGSFFRLNLLPCRIESLLRRSRYVEDKLLAWQILHKDDYRYSLDHPTQDRIVDDCSRVIDVDAETGVPTLLNRETVYLRGGEISREVYATLVEDLMYRDDQEFDESVEDRMKLLLGIHHDESCEFADTDVSEEVGRSVQ